MKDLLIQIVKSLVDNPEQVQITEIEGSQTVVLELRVDKSDMGKIISHPLGFSSYSGVKGGDNNEVIFR